MRTVKFLDRSMLQAAMSTSEPMGLSHMRRGYPIQSFWSIKGILLDFMIAPGIIESVNQVDQFQNEWQGRKS